MPEDNIDARLARLTERHEALTQVIELMQHDWEDRFTRVTDGMNRLTEAMTALAEATTNLADIVRRHEDRLNRLEGGRE